MLNRENRETAVVIFSIVSAMSHFNGSFTLCPYLNEGLGHSIYRLGLALIYSVYIPLKTYTKTMQSLCFLISRHTYTQRNALVCRYGPWHLYSQANEQTLLQANTSAHMFTHTATFLQKQWSCQLCCCGKEITGNSNHRSSLNPFHNTPDGSLPGVEDERV